MNAQERSEHIRKLVDQAPPLTETQRARLRVLLRPAVPGKGAGRGQDAQTPA